MAKKKKAFGFNVAVRNLDEAVARFKALLEVEPKTLHPADFAFPGLNGASFNLGGFVINLITSADKNTSVGNFLEKRGEGFFLFSMEVEDVAHEISRLKTRNFSFIPQDIVNHPGWGQIIFVHPKSLNGIQVEMIQPPKA